MTVTVWFVRDGPQMQRGSSAYQLPLATCVARLGLKKEQWVSGLDRTPRFGDQSKRHSELEPYRHAVCAIDEAEAKASGWRGRLLPNRTRPQGGDRTVRTTSASRA